MMGRTYLVIALLLLTLASGARSESCKDDPTWYKDGKTYKTCDWIGRSANRRANLCTFDNIQTKCPQACRVCCEDDSTFTVTTLSTKERSCRWLSKKIDRQEKYCEVVENGTLVENKCPVACGLCTQAPTKSPSPSHKPSREPTNNPSMVPSLAPTPIASDAPTDFPTVTSRPTVDACLNDHDFKKGDDPKKTCDWISLKESRRVRMCTYGYIKDNCPQACRTCCGDDPDFEVTINRGGTKPCNWIGKNRDRQRRYCKEIQDKVLVESRCPVSCGLCTARTRSPTGMPSPGPSVVPSLPVSSKPSNSPSSAPTLSFPPSFLPSNTPTMPTPQPTVCSENPQAQFYWGLNFQNKPVFQTCTWLSGRKNKASICADRTGSYGAIGPARDVCKVTCDECYTDMPSSLPTTTPSKKPSNEPSLRPSVNPTISHEPTVTPSTYPSMVPSFGPTPQLSNNPSSIPSLIPSETLSGGPSTSPSGLPTQNPSVAPSAKPSSDPTSTPSTSPSSSPTSKPSHSPSIAPSPIRSGEPSNSPTLTLSENPSANPSRSPTSIPSPSPTNSPSLSPSPTNIFSEAPSTCPENADLKFFHKFNQSTGLPIFHSCGWLKQRDQLFIDIACANTVSNGGFGPAQEVCRNTCDTCT